MKKLIALIAFGVGYVLGAKAGHTRYDQIMRLVTRVKDEPHVQQAARQATDFAREQAPAAKDKAADVASRIADKVRPDSHTGDGPYPDGSYVQDDPYLRGPVP